MYVHPIHPSEFWGLGKIGIGKIYFYNKSVVATRIVGAVNDLNDSIFWI